ncbi:hypothetical protein EV2_005030 [Malus domestica]
MRGDDHGGSRLSHVPHAQSAVAGGGGEYIGVAGVPYGGVDAVCVFLEGSNRGRAVNGPELDGVVPGGGEEGVTARGVVIGGADLARVLVEGAKGIGGRGQSGIVNLDGSVGDGGD